MNDSKVATVEAQAVPTKEQALDLIGELEAVRTLNAPEGYILTSGLTTLRRFIEQAEVPGMAPLEDAALICDRLAGLYKRTDVGFDTGYRMACERAAREIRAFTRPTPAAADLHLDELPQEIADAICLEVSELPDRNSPEDWPEAMLVTHDELKAIVINVLANLETTP